MGPALLWLWSKNTATVPSQPLAWELPYATGVALKRQKKNRHGVGEREAKTKGGREEAVGKVRCDQRGVGHG